MFNGEKAIISNPGNAQVNALQAFRRPALICWTRSCVDPFQAGLIDNIYVQIIVEPNLTREPCVVVQIRFSGKYCSLSFTDLARVAREHLDAAGGTSGIPAAAV